MVRQILILFLLTISLYSKGQFRRWGVYPSLEYMYQTKHTVGTYLSLHRHMGTLDTAKHNHSFLRLGFGGVLHNEKKIIYYAPSVAIEGFYQLYKRKLSCGPRFRIGYTNFLISGKTDNYLWGDIGFGFVGMVVFVGYNLNLDFKDLNQVGAFRVGFKMP